MVYSRDFTYGHQNQSDSHNQMLGKIEWIIFHYSENVLISASYSWFYGALWEWWKKKNFKQFTLWWQHEYEMSKKNIIYKKSSTELSDIDNINIDWKYLNQFSVSVDQMKFEANVGRWIGLE